MRLSITPASERSGIVDGEPPLWRRCTKVYPARHSHDTDQPSPPLLRSMIAIVHRDTHTSRSCSSAISIDHT